MMKSSNDYREIRAPRAPQRRHSPPHEEEETASSTKDATQTDADSQDEGIHLRVV